jgi:hypothetical protein
MIQRRLVIVIAILVLIGVGLRLAVTAVVLSGYRVIDDDNIVLAMSGAHPTWRSVTSVEDTPARVTVGVSQVYLQLGPGFDDTIAYEVVRLDEPLAGRPVFDAATGLSIPQLSP